MTDRLATASWQEIDFDPQARRLPRGRGTSTRPACADPGLVSPKRRVDCWYIACWTYACVLLVGCFRRIDCMEGGGNRRVVGQVKVCKQDTDRAGLSNLACGQGRPLIGS
jgi:hypothetical protein